MSRRRRRTRAWATGVVSPAAASQRTTTSRCGRRAPGAHRASAGASSANASPCTSVSPSPRATSGEAISRPSSGAMTTVSVRPSYSADSTSRVGALEALGAEREVGRLLEDAAEEDAQGELGAGARLGRVAALAARLEVVAQPAEPGERVHGGQEARQPREQADALLDEVRRQRAVAVQRAVAAPAAHDLEGDLGAVRGLGGELPGRLLDEGGQGAVELAVVHGRAVRRGPALSCRAHGALQRGATLAALTASTEMWVRDSRPWVTLCAAAARSRPSGRGPGHHEVVVGPPPRARRARAPGARAASASSPTRWPAPRRAPRRGAGASRARARGGGVSRVNGIGSSRRSPSRAASGSWTTAAIVSRARLADRHRRSPRSQRRPGARRAVERHEHPVDRRRPPRPVPAGASAERPCDEPCAITLLDGMRNACRRVSPQDRLLSRRSSIVRFLAWRPRSLPPPPRR